MLDPTHPDWNPHSGLDPSQIPNFNYPPADMLGSGGGLNRMIQMGIGGAGLDSTIAAGTVQAVLGNPKFAAALGKMRPDQQAKLSGLLGGRLGAMTAGGSAAGGIAAGVSGAGAAPSHAPQTPDAQAQAAQAQAAQAQAAQAQAAQAQAAQAQAAQAAAGPPLPTEAGWYADPWQQARLRWFDGAAWTANTSNGG